MKKKTAGSRPKGVDTWADAPPADAWGQAKVFFIFYFQTFLLMWVCVWGLKVLVYEASSY